MAEKVVKQKKKISVSAFEKVMKENFAPTTKIVTWHGLDITVKQTLSFEDTLVFVDGVVKSCFAENTGEYLPEIRDFAIKSCVLEMYANFALPVNTERRHELIYNTDAYDTVVNNIDKRQLTEIIDAINQKIYNILQANIESINAQMNKVYSTLDNLEKQFSDMLDGISPEDVSKFLGAVSAVDVANVYTASNKTDATDTVDVGE